MSTQSPNQLTKLWMVAPFIASGWAWAFLQNVWIAVAIFHGGMLAALLIHRKKWDPTRIWKGGKLRWLIPIGIFMGGFGYWFYLRHQKFQEGLSNRFEAFEMVGPMIPLLAIYFCLVNPVLEECFWRGLFGSKRRGPALSDFAYGCFHFFILMPFTKTPDACVAVVALIIMGYVWRQITNRTNGHRLAIIWHFLGDVAVIGAMASVVQ